MNEQVACARRYMEAYAAGDRTGVAECLTDDVVWRIYGHARLAGKAAYLGEMARGETAGSPEVVAERYVEQGDTVVVTGRVRAPLPEPDGGFFHAVFSDVFTFRDGRAGVVESFVVPITETQFREVSKAEEQRK